MPEIIVNQKIADALSNHGVETTVDDQFVYAHLPSPIRLKTRAIYSEINGRISSQLDVMIITDKGEKILESFGDWGHDLDTAISNNLTGFCVGTLHPLLAAFGADAKHLLDHVEIEEWKINGKVWTAYIGNLIPKMHSKNAHIQPPAQFFKAMEASIRAQPLNNRLHWFRGYYMQHDGEITTAEFVMDNVDVTANNPLFSTLPIIPGVEFFSCRNFIILKQKMDR